MQLTHSQYVSAWNAAEYYDNEAEKQTGYFHFQNFTKYINLFRNIFF